MGNKNIGTVKQNMTAKESYAMWNIVFASLKCIITMRRTKNYRLSVKSHDYSCEKKLGHKTNQDYVGIKKNYT
jgi:hypothetical protein